MIFVMLGSALSVLSLFTFLLHIIHFCSTCYMILTMCIIQVSINGYFSLGDAPDITPEKIPSSTNYIVAPFAANVDITYTGSVLYTDFNAYSSSSSAMNNVNAFIQSRSYWYERFSGDRMMVAEWRQVPQRNQNSVSIF